MADIFGVRVTADLNILDTLIIICNTAGGQTEPAVTFAGQNYFVTWLDQAFQTRNSPVAVARVNPQGIVLDSVALIGTGDYHPDIAFDGIAVSQSGLRNSTAWSGVLLTPQDNPKGR